MENKLDKFKKILEVSSRDTISAKEIEKFLILVLTTIKKERELFIGVSDKQKNDIEQNLRYIEEVKNELSKNIDNSLETTKSSFEKEIQAVKDLIKNIELTPGESIKGDDGYTPIKGIDYSDGSPDTGEQIVDKINELSITSDNQIDASHIKNLPKMVQNQIGGVVARNIYQMGDVSLNLLSNNQSLKWDDTNKLWINYTPSSGGTVGPGTTNELAYFNAPTTITSLPVATYPSITELSYVKGVTSAIQTQFTGKLSLTGGTMVGNILFTDNTYDIGASGATRPRTLYLGTSLLSPSIKATSAGGYLSSDGTAGASATTGGATFKDGLYTSGTISAGSSFTWTVTTVNANMAVANGYLANKGTLLTMTLPATAAVGDIVEIAGMNAGLWKIAQNASGIIHFGNQNTTTGVGGSLASTATYDAVKLVCIVANNEWVVTSSIGTITVV